MKDEGFYQGFFSKGNKTFIDINVEGKDIEAVISWINLTIVDLNNFTSINSVPDYWQATIDKFKERSFNCLNVYSRLGFQNPTFFGNVGEEVVNDLISVIAKEESICDQKGKQSVYELALFIFGCFFILFFLFIFKKCDLFSRKSSVNHLDEPFKVNINSQSRDEFSRFNSSSSADAKCSEGEGGIFNVPAKLL